MKRICINLLVCVVGMLVVTGATRNAQGLELRLESVREAQLVGEPSDIRLFLVNKGPEPALIDRAFLQLNIEMEMGGEWLACGQQQFAILPGVREKAEWQRIEPGGELLIGLGGFWCPEDAGPASRGRSWRERPGDYKLRVEASHRVPAQALEQIGPAPDGANEWTLRSKVIAIAVNEPTGIDAEALGWAREHGHDPAFSVEVANAFPDSRYADWAVWKLLSIHGGKPEQLKEAMERGFYPGWNSVPDPSSPDGRRTVNAGEDMARWRIEQGERLLRKGNFPYARDVRLSVAVSYAAIGNKEKAVQLLNSLKSETGTPESQWAAGFLALQGWQ